MSTRGGGVFRGDYRGRGSTGSRGGRGGSRITEPKQIFQQQNTQEFSVPAITSLENRFFSSTSTRQLADLKLDDEVSIPVRPGFGTLGKEIELYTNSVELLIKSPKPIHKYSVSILSANRDQEPKGRKRVRVIALLLDQLPQLPLLATDYSTIIIATSRFVTTSQDYDVPYSREDDEAHHVLQHYTVRVEYSNTLDFNDLIACLNSTDMQRWRPVDLQDWIQVLNIVIGHRLKAANTEIIARQNKYFPYNDGNRFTEKVALDVLMSAFRGYFVSSRPATGRMLLQIQVKHIAVWLPLRLNEVLSHLSKTPEGLASAKGLLSGVRVRLTHLNNARVKRVAGFATRFDGRNLEHPPIITEQDLKTKARAIARADQVQFWKNDDLKYVTVAQYFKQVYNMSSDLPVVNLGTHDMPSYYLPEVCEIVPGQPVNCQLSPAQTAAMIAFAVRKPHQNATSITTNGVGLVNQYSGQALGEVGVSLGQSLVRVTGRLLPGPNVEYAKSRIIHPNGASWNMININFSKGTSLSTWSVLVIRQDSTEKSGKSPKDAFSDVADLQVCVDRFKDVLRISGVQLGAMLPIRDISIQKEDQCQQPIDEYFKKAVAFGCKLLLVILPSKSATVYNTIKKAGDIAYGVHTVCVTASVFGKNRDQEPPGNSVPNVQTFANIALKFNLKLGGCNQQLSRSNLDFIANGKTMLVGLDVTHPAPGQIKAPSVAAIVASVDKSLGQWPADIRVQQRRQEMVQALEEMFVGRLKLWQKHNKNALPDEILVYRDGVSEGQYNIVLQTELPQMRKACEKVYPATQTKKGLPNITIVIVGKRHHTRFYPTKMEDADPTGNNRNGTVVDRGVTVACVWDFYLQAHTALQGTARPAHYVVIHDEIFRKRFRSAPGAADALWRVTHNLCYLFGRATKAVSICPPAYYADIACERARRWLSRVFDDNMTVSSGDSREISSDETKVHELLKDTMFYI